MEVVLIFSEDSFFFLAARINESVLVFSKYPEGRSLVPDLRSARITANDSLLLLIRFSSAEIPLKPFIAPL